MELSVQELSSSETIQPKTGGIVTIAEYRKLSGDKFSSDQKVLERITYLENFCRIVIQSELNVYAKET